MPDLFSPGRTGPTTARPRLCALLTLRALLTLGGLGAIAPSHAFVVAINSGSPRVTFLQVGDPNSRVNLVRSDLTLTQVGNGTPVQMVTDVSATQSSIAPANGTPYGVPSARPGCAPASGQVLVAMFYRNGNDNLRPRGFLQASTNAPTLVNATGDSIPFSSISWTSNANPTTNIPAGSFNGSWGPVSFGADSYVENCLTFFYNNSTVYPEGTYTGRVTYTVYAQ